MNKNLNTLIGRMSSKLEIDEKSQVRLLEETQHYFDDLNYEINFVSRETRALQDQLRALLAVKSTSPLVLSREPTFTVPRFYQNNEIIFMG